MEEDIGTKAVREMRRHPDCRVAGHIYDWFLEGVDDRNTGFGVVSGGGGLAPEATDPLGYPREPLFAGKDEIIPGFITNRGQTGPSPPWPYGPPEPPWPWGLLGAPDSTYCRTRGGEAYLCGFEENAGHASTPPKKYKTKTKTGDLTLIRVPDASPAPDCETIPTVAATLSCRTRGGTASLVGHSEWSGYESSPPKKYLNKDFGGTMHCKTWAHSGDPCSSLALDCVHALSGGCHYSAADGSVTIDNGLRTTTGPSDPSYCTPGTYPLSCGGGMPGPLCTGYDCGTITETTATLIVRTGTEVCAWCGDAYADHSVTGSNSVILSIEDTEANAISRLLSGMGGVWSGYAAGSSTTCLADWQQRTTGFSFAYQESQFQIEKTGLLPDTSYAVTVDVMRQVFGTGSFELYQTITVAGETDGSGNLTISDQDVPNLVGYETYVTNAQVQLKQEWTDHWDWSQEFIPTLGDCGEQAAVDNSTRKLNGVLVAGGPSTMQYAGLSTVTTTANQIVTVGSELCVWAPRTYDDPFPWAKLVGTLTEELSEPDSDADAIARLMAGTGGTWGIWNLIGDGSGDTCLPSVCCLARWQQRTTGFTIVYQESQWKAEWVGLAEIPYYVYINDWRRVFGVDPFAWYLSVLLSGTPDFLGNLELTYNVPNDAGYDTFAML